MKHKVAELVGGLLDAAVAKAEGLPVHPGRDRYVVAAPLSARWADEFAFSSSWQDGGPIIERERICLMFIGERGWSANFEQYFNEGDQEDPHTGPTPLIAAMRAYVASKFGDEVELP